MSDNIIELALRPVVKSAVVIAMAVAGLMLIGPLVALGLLILGGGAMFGRDAHRKFKDVVEREDGTVWSRLLEYKPSDEVAQDVQQNQSLSQEYAHESSQARDAQVEREGAYIDLTPIVIEHSDDDEEGLLSRSESEEREQASVTR